MTLARDKATMTDVRRLLQVRAADFARRPSPRALAASLSVERFSCVFDSRLYWAVCRFRTLRQDARIAAAARALSSDEPAAGPLEKASK